MNIAGLWLQRIRVAQPQKCVTPARCCCSQCWVLLKKRRFPKLNTEENICRNLKRKSALVDRDANIATQPKHHKLVWFHDVLIKPARSRTEASCDRSRNSRAPMCCLVSPLSSPEAEAARAQGGLFNRAVVWEAVNIFPAPRGDPGLFNLARGISCWQSCIASGVSAF